MNLNYFFEKIASRYAEKDAESILKLLMRSKKMYEAIDIVLLVFSIITRR